MNINNLELKYKVANKHINKDVKLDKIIVNFIRDNKLLMYGGTAIDKLIRYKSKNEDKLYDYTYDVVDYDVLSYNFIEMAEKLAKILSKEYMYVKTVTGMTGKTRKIFINIKNDAIIDISYISEEHYTTMKKIDIDGILYCDPQYLKTDQYQNIVTNLYLDHFRLIKALNKIKLLEQYFPVKFLYYQTVKNKEYTKKDDIGYSFNQLIEKFDPILGGDYVFNIYYEDDKIDNPEIVLYTNSYTSDHIKSAGIRKSPKYRIMPLLGATFYNNYEGKYKIVTKPFLLWYYYLLQFKLFKRVNFVKQINILLQDPETFIAYENNTDLPEIYYSEERYIRETTTPIKTSYIKNKVMLK